jgi:hypothetical protein
MAHPIYIASMSIALLGAALTGADAAQQTDTPPPASEQGMGMDAALDEIMAELTKAGPKRPDWNKGGADIRAEVTAAPGGSRQNYILTTDKAGSRTLTIVDGRGAADIIPSNWEKVVSIGKPPIGDITTDLTIGQLEGPYYFAGTQGRRRVGDAYCTSGPMSGTVYKDRNGSSDMDLPKAMAQAIFERMFEQFESMNACFRYDRDGDGFRTSNYLEDGSSLPKVDETIGERLQIVPAAPVDKLLTPPKSN